MARLFAGCKISFATQTFMASPTNGPEMHASAAQAHILPPRAESGLAWFQPALQAARVLRTTPVLELIAETSSISKRDLLMRNTSLSEARKDGTLFE
jgi:hypothetical protein